jgi:flavin-dependent dehydrogenase
MHFAIGPSGDGYGWIFPLPNGRANVGLGFVRDEPGADALHAAFERFLQRPELRGARECGPRKSWPIPFGWRATPVAAPGALLAGDAASLASALSGSGIHTALASGALAADVALEALGSGAAYGRRLAPIARRLQLEALVHRIAGTPATSERAIGVLRRIPGAGRAAAPFLLNLG